VGVPCASRHLLHAHEWRPCPLDCLSMHMGVEIVDSLVCGLNLVFISTVRRHFNAVEAGYVLRPGESK
jgi:hypothetical protein